MTANSRCRPTADGGERQLSGRSNRVLL